MSWPYSRERVKDGCLDICESKFSKLIPVNGPVGLWSSPHIKGMIPPCLHFQKVQTSLVCLFYPRVSEDASKPYSLRVRPKSLRSR